MVEQFLIGCGAQQLIRVLSIFQMKLLGSIKIRRNINCPAFLMHSGGGVMSFQDAIKFPVRLVESGPAGGAMFAADLASRYGLPHLEGFQKY